jgi:hypothetical protein
LVFLDARMRRAVLAFLFLALAAGPVLAQQPAPIPYAWLFGAWTGGMFPPPSSLSAEACIAQPVVMFTRDVVLRGQIADSRYVQRVIDTARAVPGGVEFRFQPQPQPLGAGILGLPNEVAPQGFGCAHPDWLGVKRISDTLIEFPGCADFPFPLRRCPPR